ncbi:MAG: hypothetical protein US96_C0018G0022 [Candidatus Woesebacteria bacterium GW2011_GWB1_38_5b]|uniref:ATP-cone domain-containing protein n=1 Tax=Candidatus Woesebacteria bacterium GW2011_GWB1_38_5b TaxID=1618569 RepID=A0A0G0KHM6_9BACT|nr:MAG: hypothetical protein US96_C0018G0022 [Candidatus Woesebacteria bacterium GW2011_GWB1_38_5b]
MSISKSGVPIEDAQKIAENIESWVLAKDSKFITSVEIRDKVIEALSKSFPSEASCYSFYKKG